MLRDFIHHDNAARPHQALDLQVPEAQPRASPAASRRIVGSIAYAVAHRRRWAAMRNRLELTARERCVVQLIAGGASNREVLTKHEVRRVSGIVGAV